LATGTIGPACQADQDNDQEEGMLRSMSRPMILTLALVAVIACGVLLRVFGYSVHLPFVVVKYGGSALWAVMVYLLVALAFARLRPVRLAAIAVLVATCVEFSRLAHVPSLDEFRLTLAGALLLGRIFSLWNIVAYSVGIVAALVADMTLGRGGGHNSISARD
jgi:hypothetical protein